MADDQWNNYSDYFARRDGEVSGERSTAPHETDFQRRKRTGELGNAQADTKESAEARAREAKRLQDLETAHEETRVMAMNGGNGATQLTEADVTRIVKAEILRFAGSITGGLACNIPAGTGGVITFSYTYS